MSNIKVLKFSAPWCGPCKALKPVWEKLESEYNGRKNIELISIDVDDEPDLSVKFSVRSIPTIVYLENEKEVHRINGLVSSKSIEDKIGELLN